LRTAFLALTQSCSQTGRDILAGVTGYLTEPACDPRELDGRIRGVPPARPPCQWLWDYQLSTAATRLASLAKKLRLCKKRYDEGLPPAWRRETAGFLVSQVVLDGAEVRVYHKEVTWAWLDVALPADFPTG